MDRIEHEEFGGGDGSIEDWLDRLEAKMEAMDIRTERKKIHWCKARIGSTGLQVLKGIDPINSWEQAKAELKRYFGDDDTIEAARRNLEFYRSGSKSLGEIAAELSKYARRASGEEDTQQRLAVRAFINAIPRRIGNKLREKRISTLKKVLEEAKYLQTLQEESDRDRPVNKVNIHQTAMEKEGDIMPLEIQNQMFRPRGASGIPQRPREMRNHRIQDMECWACRQRGHFARECTLWLEFMRSRQQERQPRERRNMIQGQEEAVTYQLNW